MTLYIVQDKIMQEVKTVNCTADTAGTIDLPENDLVALLYNGASYYIQLKSGTDVYESYRVVTLSN